MFLGKLFWKYAEILRRTPTPNCFCNFIEIAFRYVCSPVNILHISGTPSYKNTDGGLLLKFIQTMKIKPVFLMIFPHMNKILFSWVKVSPFYALQSVLKSTFDLKYCQPHFFWNCSNCVEVSILAFAFTNILFPRLQLYFTRVSDTGVFLWILWSF